MPCLLTLLALATPRVVIVVVWLFSHWFRVLNSNLWLVLGFIFLPTTLLWYTAVLHWWAGQWTFWTVAGLVIALMIDVSPARHSRRRN